MPGAPASASTHRPESSATAGRPLSKGREALLEMEKERFPLYERAADLIVENTAAFDAAVQTALEKTKEYFEGK